MMTQIVPEVVTTSGVACGKCGIELDDEDQVTLGMPQARDGYILLRVLCPACFDEEDGE